MTSRNFGTIFDPIPLIITLFSTKALLLASQNPLLRDVIYGRPLNTINEIHQDSKLFCDKHLFKRENESQNPKCTTSTPLWGEKEAHISEVFF